ncbi:hypothetical protein F4806DRAFT_495864 [Annulohypoxylon nitens]|nr:hypothetical protein F4806DRAFT_495864 [Annulohypoxylon nitens]
MLPSPQISFTRVSEHKIRHLTKLLGQAELTAQEIDEIIERSAARARRGGSRSELRGVENGTTLNEIDELFGADQLGQQFVPPVPRKQANREDPSGAQNYEINEAEKSPDGQELSRSMNFLTDEFMTSGTDANDCCCAKSQTPLSQEMRYTYKNLLLSTLSCRTYGRLTAPSL